MTQLKEPLDLKAAYKTSLESPSKTLSINVMQYVENFSVAATEYGKNSKDNAWKVYADIVKQKHKNL